MALWIPVFSLKQMSCTTAEVAFMGYILKQSNDLPYSVEIQTMDCSNGLAFPFHLGTMRPTHFNFSICPAGPKHLLHVLHRTAVGV